MRNRKKSRRDASECGTLLVFAPHRATDRFLRYVRTRSASLDWSVVDRWSADGRGFLVVHMDAAGDNMFELVAKDARELMAETLREAASRAGDVARTQAGGIGSHRTLEAVNAQWVALGGITNPQFDPDVSVH